MTTHPTRAFVTAITTLIPEDKQVTARRALATLEEHARTDERRRCAEICVAGVNPDFPDDPDASEFELLHATLDLAIRTAAPIDLTDQATVSRYTRNLFDLAAKMRNYLTPPDTYPAKEVNSPSTGTAGEPTSSTPHTSATPATGLSFRCDGSPRPNQKNSGE